MIDIHTHLLYGADDGASTLEEALDMVRRAQADGITAMVATPHSTNLPPALVADEIPRRVQALQEELDRNGMAVRLYPGLENYLDLELPKRLEAGHALPLNRGPYVLVELPLTQYPLYTEHVLFELQIKGLVPVLAHPERNADVSRDHSLLERLVERGVLAQVTAASLLGAFGTEVKRSAEAFVKRRLVHIIASDAHGPAGHRSPVLSAAVAAASRLVGREQAQAMVTSLPQAILEGRRLAVEPPLPARRRFSFGG